MFHVNKIPLDFEPRKEIESKLVKPSNIPEVILMTEFESGFLCGLLNKFKPKKILEVGVCSGGTTAIILQCMEKIGQPYEMHSVDVAEKCPHDISRETGFFAAPVIANLKCGRHEFHLGRSIPFLLDAMGGGIDFLILDTTHSLPGEVLDFLVALPYLKEDAVVCLHDISLTQDNTLIVNGKLMNFITEPGHFHDNATAALLASVVADKFLNLIIGNDLALRYPNISAFQITPDTMKNIENVFLTLVLRWRYLPGNDMLSYSELILRHYPKELYSIFQETIRMNYLNLVREAQLLAAKNEVPH